jgi:excisionase family DNA binding protein
MATIGPLLRACSPQTQQCPWALHLCQQPGRGGSRPTPDRGDRPSPAPPSSPTAPLDLAGSSTSTLATLPEVLTVREAAAAILRVGRNQLYQAIGRGEVDAVRIGRSIRIPKHALLDLLAAASPPPASGDE